MASKGTNTQQRHQTVRVHGGQSNRRTKDRGESKIVFKSVLTNPFEVKWPIISPSVQNAILARVIELMQGVAEYNLNRHKLSRESRTERRAAKRAKKVNNIRKRNQSQNAIVVDNDSAQNNNSEAQKIGASTSSSTTRAPRPESGAVPAPEFLQHMTIGINAVTKRLEAQCRIQRQVIAPSPPPPHPETQLNRDPKRDPGGTANLSGEENAASAVHLPEVEMIDGTDAVVPSSSLSSSRSASSSTNNAIDGRAPVRTVLVCRSDVDPPLLIAHIPHLVAACNSSSNSATSRDPNVLNTKQGSRVKVKLVPLPKGAESALATAMGLRRVSILAFDETLSSDPILSPLLSSIQTVFAPWLVGLTSSPAPRSTSTLRSNSTPPKRVHKQLKLLPVPGARRLIPTHIKQLRTTAPKDMRLAKTLRAKGRLEAKAQRIARAKAKVEDKTAKRGET